MPLTRRVGPLVLVVLTALASASCGTPSGPAGPATPVAPRSVDGGGWFSYEPMTGTATADASPPAGPTPTTATATATATAAPATDGGRAMDTDQFWRLVDRAASPDAAGAAESLYGALSALPPDDVLAFEREFVRQMDRSNTFLHHAAAETMMGSTSQDVFVGLRTWVLAQGRDVYDAFVADPDSLAAHGPDDDEQIGAAESFEGVALDVWSTQTGRDPFADGSGVPVGDSVSDEPRGTRLDEAQRRARFPRLTAAYVGGDPSVGPAPVQRR
ncbi:DUF4240 domain-containing protein [Terracoccus sp. 273MFTsu3.1]|uniref:DUF4240 domain-containing protein n=1 Tax=Terracoccus sp. 273MFTsu3.1 TaxID=1172188 RepID=UPI0018CB3BCC|nr:DUF4240 domain-containing protein [Terracoccus sp. 273MFTsu3.1]